ncbi:MAG: leucyl/phenylalanyl-tRNA--protein transferase [Planctomycetota bacterium]
MAPSTKFRMRPPPPIVETLLRVYREGSFPMADSRDGEIYLVTPKRRGMLHLGEGEMPGSLHVPRSVERLLRKQRFELTSDRAFSEVLRGCAMPRTTDAETWLSPEIIDWVEELHSYGFAHSIEAWRRDQDNTPHLVGGIYGISIGGVFFAESMFHVPRERLDNGTRHLLDGSGASKVCLVTLVRHLQRCAYTVLDTQFQNSHIERFGVIEIEQAEFMDLVQPALTSTRARWKPLKSCQDD